MKTLLLALISTGKSKGTREGAIRGLIGVGKEAVRKGLVEGGGARVLGSECVNGETGPLLDSVMVSPCMTARRNANHGCCRMR
jgi:transcription initiation factor TFIID subunit 6